MWRRYRKLSAPLHRRIFGWFGLTIVLAAIVGFGVASLLGGGSEFRRTYNGARKIMANRFAEVWDDAPRRKALAEELSQEMRVDVTIRDTSGAALEVVGGSECARHDLTLEPQRAGVTLGRVDVCTARPIHHPLAGILGLLAGVGVLWLVSHKIARRLGRPILDLVKVTDAIGRGNYDVDIKCGRHAPTEIQHLNGAVRDMASKIKKQLADQRELLASVSHELRSPLARVRLLLELSRDETLPADRKAKLLDDLEQEVIEIDDLVGGLLAQSRLDFAALTMRPNDLVASARRALERAGIDLEPAIIGEPGQVHYDATLIARAFTNLLDNAAKHGEGVTQLTVRFDDDRVTIEVHDRGPGLPATESERIFDPFVGSASGAHDSLGLGLALVRRIALAHGGEVFAKDRDGGGATIGLWIARATPA